MNILLTVVAALVKIVANLIGTSILKFFAVGGSRAYKKDVYEVKTQKMAASSSY